MKPMLYSAGLLLLLAAHTAAEAETTKAPKTAEVWMAVLPADVLVQDGAQWDFVKKHVDGIKFWTQQVDDEPETWPFQGGVPAPGAFQKLVDLCNAEKIPMFVEKGLWPQRMPDPAAERMGGLAGPYDDTYGKRAADNEIARLKRLAARGCRITALDMDGPIRHMMYPLQGGTGFSTYDEAIDAYLTYMKLVQAEFPAIQFYELTNFPNYGYKGEPSYHGVMFWGDYHEAILKLVAAVKEHNAPLKGITVDNPYDYAMGTRPMPHVTNIDHAKIDWTARILDLERIAHENGLEFNLIINAEGSGGADMAQYCKDTLAFLDMYTARGGRPDRWIVQSWYTHPLRDEVVPETKPNTFTWLVKEVIRKVKGIAE